MLFLFNVLMEAKSKYLDHLISFETDICCFSYHRIMNRIFYDLVFLFDFM